MKLSEISSAKDTLSRLVGALHKEHLYTGMGYKDLVLIHRAEWVFTFSEGLYT